MKDLIWNVLSVEDDLRNLHLTTTLLQLHCLLIQSHRTRTFCLQQMPPCPGAPAFPDAGQICLSHWPQTTGDFSLDPLKASSCLSSHLLQTFLTQNSDNVHQCAC